MSKSLHVYYHPYDILMRKQLQSLFLYVYGFLKRCVCRCACTGVALIAGLDLAGSGRVIVQSHSIPHISTGRLRPCGTASSNDRLLGQERGPRLRVKGGVYGYASTESTVVRVAQ